MYAKHLWPEGVRCVVSISVDFDGPSVDVGRGRDILGVYSNGRYSARRGIPRVLDLLDRYEIPATFFVPGYDAEQYPDTVLEVRRRGHEVAAHGYLHEWQDLDREEERELLHRTHKILSDLMGEPPRGYRNPGGKRTQWTIPFLRELGYLYDAGDKDHDVPYMIRVDGQRVEDMVELPNNTATLDDHPFWWISFTPPSEVLQQWKQEFEALYQENGFFSLTFHPRNGYGSGTPSRVRVVEELIRFIRQHEGVMFVRLIDLTNWCLSRPGDFE